jgi:small conductance mechanosensitive channel
VRDRLADLIDRPYVAVIVILLCAMVTIRISSFVIRRVIRRLARRSLILPLGSGGLWGSRVRTREESGGEIEQRRRQRIDAASRMTSHLATVVIWLVATIVAFHVLDFDPTFYLSSAGFIGAAIAIGGQHKVSDYLTGLSVHFEDRYGVGDEVEVEIGGNTVTAVVDHIGLFSTRLRDSRSTLHVPNSTLAAVRNLSQEAAVSTIKLHVPDDASPADAMSMLRGLAGSDGLTDVIFVGDLDAHARSTGEVEVELRTARALDDQSKSQLVRRAEALLENPTAEQPATPAGQETTRRR